MAKSRAVWRPTSRLGAWAIGAAGASVGGFWAATVVPDRVGWNAVGMAGAAAGLGLGLAGGTLALLTIWLGHERIRAVIVAFVPFSGAVYLIRRSLVTT